MLVRIAATDEVDALAEIWHEGWHVAHAPVVPAALTALRTLESFRHRLDAAIAEVRVIGPVGSPLGFYIVKDTELYQLFVAAQARGTGVAAALLSDGERRLAGHGIETAWLACAIGNDRAAAFYEKHGWRCTGTIVNPVETSNGPFPLEVWRYEKRLSLGTR